MFYEIGEEIPMYEGEYTPFITEWNIVHLVCEEKKTVEDATALIEEVKNLPTSYKKEIVLDDNYPCKVEGHVYGHPSYPFIEGSPIITSEIRRIEKIENTTNVVSVTTKSGSIYYLSV